MAYEKQTWACGDTITADKLNHMEDGIANAGGGALICEVIQEGNKTRLNKTFGEIKEAINSGRQVFARGVNAKGIETTIPFIVFGVYPSGGGAIQFDNTAALESETDSDYPTEKMNN